MLDPRESLRYTEAWKKNPARGQEARMGFVDRELEKLSRALCENPDGEHYAELYAAQQALGWATDPKAFRSPYNMIMGIPAETADCPECRDPLPS